MAVTSTTHLNFRGDARGALDFYHAVFGGDRTIVTYGDAGAAQDPAAANQVMWGQVLSANGFHVMAYDVPSYMAYDPGENAYFVSVRGQSAEEITPLWQGLSEGSTIVVPLAPAQWSPLYGMLKDRFGVVWVMDVALPSDGK